MYPALKSGDRLIVLKYCYLKCGDIVVSKISYPRGSENELVVVKRIDEICFQNNRREYILIGDNTQASIDSRDPNFGPVDRQHIKGKALMHMKG